MFKLALLNRKLIKRGVLAFGCITLSFGFTIEFDKIEAISFSSRCLYKGFDPTEEGKIKGWQFYITPDNFMRFNKNYYKGRKAYYSFNLRRLEGVTYIGDSIKGVVQIKTHADDIIVQTYNDPKGNVDSMVTILRIPVRNVSASQIDSLAKALNYLKAQ